MSQCGDLICDCSVIICGIIAFKIYDHDLKHSVLVKQILGSESATVLRGPSKVKEVFFFLMML